MALNNRLIPMVWAVRTSVAPLSVAQSVQEQIRAASELPAANIRTLEEVTAASAARNRFNTFLLGVFAFIAVLPA